MTEAINWCARNTTDHGCGLVGTLKEPRFCVLTVDGDRVCTPGGPDTQICSGCESDEGCGDPGLVCVDAEGCCQRDNLGVRRTICV